MLVSPVVEAWDGKQLSFDYVRRNGAAALLLAPLRTERFSMVKSRPLWLSRKSCQSLNLRR